MNSYYKMFFLFLVTLFVLATPVFSLNMTEMPENLQTKIQAPQARTFSLKLPLLQPDFHWTFMSRDDFLSGKLLLRITRNNRTEEIVIFEKGQFTDGWAEMSEQQRPDRGEIYFGFISTAKYLTAPGDKLELELTITKDLPGIGARQSGILPAGLYKSTGTYSGLLDDYDTSALEEQLAKNGEISDEQQKLVDQLRSSLEYKAFLESWQDQWSLEITSQKGWLTEEQVASLKATLERLQTAKEVRERRETGSTKTEIDAALKVTGIVRDNKGEPVPDAVVTIPRIFRFKESKTDKDGKFSINVKLEKYQEKRILYLVIRHSQRNLTAVLKLEGDMENLEIELSPGITFSGKVFDPDRNGIQNAKIEWIIWTSETGNSIKEPLETDKQGSFHINALPPDFKYTIFAEADGYGRDYVDIQTSQTPGDSYELDPIVLKIANLSVSGIVVDINDKPVANADIYFEGPGQRMINTKTDAKGKFTVEKACEGTVRIEADVFGKIQLSGNIRTEAGSTNVKIVISEVDSSGRPVQARSSSLINKALPDISGLISDFNSEQARNKRILVCFWDYQQRPSRNCILQLAKKVQQLEEKDIVVVAVHASKIDKSTLDKWLKENNITFPVGMIDKDEEQTRFNWSVKSLPWLILTDRQHIVTADGFGMNDLDEKITTLKGK